MNLPQPMPPPNLDDPSSMQQLQDWALNMSGAGGGAKPIALFLILTLVFFILRTLRRKKVVIVAPEAAYSSPSPVRRTGWYATSETEEVYVDKGIVTAHIRPVGFGRLDDPPTARP